MTRAFHALASLFLATSATAGEIVLEAEIQAASLNDGGVDVVVYYVEQPDHFEVVATYVEKSDPTAPARMRMALTDGTSATFALPGLPGTAYTFSRAGDEVRVMATPNGTRLAHSK